MKLTEQQFRWPKDAHAMTAADLFPPRPKMFTYSGNLAPSAWATLKHIQTKHPPMTPVSPPLDDKERVWLETFVDEWARRMERGLVSRKVLRKYRATMGK